jgi:hypothetical protein
MKNLLKSTIGAAVLVGAMSPAMAEVVNVGGVTWDTDYAFDFTSTSGNIAQNFTAGEDGRTILGGYGRIDFVNFQSQSSFCPGCELTFVYGGYTSGPDFDPTSPSDAVFTGGWVNVYVDSGNNFNIDDGATAAEGELWLSLTGFDFAGGTLSVTQNAQGATGKGLLDVAGGLAASYFDTNTLAGGADVEFQTSFTVGSGFTRGSGNFGGDTAAVPEPATLGLLGLGLIGSAFAGRRRKSA